MEQQVKITAIEQLTHDVKRYQCERPAGYHFVPGQATEVSINKKGWETEARPFSFTSLASAPYLEFIIKSYTDHAGVTNELDSLQPGDELIVRDVWGAIEYKGPGYFIAGGAGITPFIAILRQLKKDRQLDGNKLFFSNKTDGDIILHEELDDMLANNVVHLITDDAATRHYKGLINEAFLKDHVPDFGSYFYLCGPPKMIEAMQQVLTRLGAAPDTVVWER
jgi:ferredoxin-NADP reductase